VSDIKRSGTPSVGEKTFPSSVAVGDYGTDLHACNTSGTFEAELGETDFVQAGSGFFQIPYEVLVPQSVDGLILGEKSISQSRLVNGATRLQPSTMNIGQAAGAAAALAVSQSKEPRAITPIAIQQALTAAGDFISKFQFTDVPKTYKSANDIPYWGDVQLISAKGI